jgi:putative membrane fusion protein
MAKKSKRNFGFKNFLFSFVAVIIAIYVFQSKSDAVDIMIVEKGTLENIIETKGIVVKDEKVYSSTVDGNITFHQEEGAKVNQGLLIEDINSSSNSSEIKAQLSQIEEAINKKTENSSENNGNSDSLVANATTNENNDEIQDIQNSIINKNYENMYETVSNINADKNLENPYNEYTLTQLSNMKKNLTNSLNTNKVPCYSQRAGILSYKIDGLENVYTFDNIYNMMPNNTVLNEYTITDMKQVSSVKSGDSLYKIIRNFNYYMAVTLSNDFAKLFEEKKYIKVRVVNDGVANDIWGYIEKINYGSDQSTLILYFDDFFNVIYDKRYVDLQLITDLHEGLKIETKSLVDKDGIKGVYVKDASNIVKFMPVKILGEDANTIVVSEGSYVSEKQRNTIDINDKKYETIKIYDNIILRPDKITEGQIVD